MKFCDKINYLFDLTHAEGKELAAELNITPPQISKMRSGVRGLPHNKESAWMIAHFFAKRCNDEYQRTALSQKIKLAHIKDLTKESELTELLLDWLSDERSINDYAAKKTKEFFQRFGNQSNREEQGDTVENGINAGSSDTGRLFSFYGTEGKRKAVLAFIQYILQRKVPHTIKILTDEKLDWMDDDPTFNNSLQSYLEKLLDQGCTFQRIAGPILDMDHAFVSLNRWFPLYMNEKASCFYYNRMRDNLNHITIFLVPKVAVVFSFSVGITQPVNGVTFFTTDINTIDSMNAEYEKYVRQCEPVMRTYSKDDSANAIHKCMLDYEGYRGNCIHRSNGLPFITLPWDTAVALETDNGKEEKDDFLLYFAQRYKIFKNNLDYIKYTDIIRLPSIDSIMTGKVQIPVSSILSKLPQYYTPAGYMQHLSNILFLLEQKENYQVVIHERDYADSTMIYVKEGFSTILIREKDPLTIYEVSEQYLVDTFSEAMHWMIPSGITEAELRQESVYKLKTLFRQIEQRMAAKKYDG